MTYTQPPIKAAGDTLTAADWNTYVGANGSALYSPPACRAVNAAGTTTASNFAMAFPTEEFDSHAIHDTSVNNSRFTVPSGWGGVWLMEASVVPTAGTAGCFITMGTATLTGATSIGGASVSITAVTAASPGDYFELSISPVGATTFTVARMSATWLRGPV